MAITTQTLRTALDRANVAMGELTDTLNAADAKLGDGDTGTMLARLIGTLADVDIGTAPDLGAAFMALAKAGAASTGSSLGTLIITGLMTAGKATAGTQSLPWTELAPLIGQVRDATMARGKAELGAKTIIDGLDALARGLEGRDSANNAADAANAALDNALQTFRDRPSAMGRARMFAEKSIGLDDPGMLGLALIVGAISGDKAEDHADTPDI